MIPCYFSIDLGFETILMHSTSACFIVVMEMSMLNRFFPKFMKFPLRGCVTTRLATLRFLNVRAAEKNFKSRKSKQSLLRQKKIKEDQKRTRREPWRAEDGSRDDLRGHQDGRPLPGGSAEGEGQSDCTSYYLWVFFDDFFGNYIYKQKLAEILSYIEGKFWMS